MATVVARAQEGAVRAHARELQLLRARLAEAEETLEAIRSGRVDALVVRGEQGEQVYTLASADRSFRELAERMSDGAATVAEDGAILWANKALANLTGWQLERLLGSPLGILLPSPADGPLARLLEAGLSSHQSGEGELRHMDGSRVPVRVSVSPVSVEGFRARAVVFSDLTEHRRNEAVLRRSAVELEYLVGERTQELAASRRDLEATEDRLRRLLEAVAGQLPAGLVVCDPSGRVVYRNAEAERMSLGTTGDDALSRAVAGESVETETTATAANGETLTLAVMAQPVRDEQDRTLAGVSVVLDVTARRKAEALRDAFIDMTAHELKTPLTTIYGVIQTLVRREATLTDSTRRELIGDAAAEAERLVHLVDDMLVLSRVERQASFLVEEPILLAHVAQAAVDAENRESLAAGASFRSTGSTIPVVRGDRGYVHQVISNLLRNATKYGAPPVEVVVQPAEAGAVVFIRDGGPGFMSDPESLFELYYQEKRTGSRPSGSGIGLFVCRELVNMMGGRIWATNRPEGGAEFGFFLPEYPHGDD